MIKSAGILVYRKGIDSSFEIYLGHMGGPFYETKDEGAWTFAKGEVENHEVEIQAAIRECREEMGIVVNEKNLVFLGLCKTKSKEIHVWAFEYTDNKPIEHCSNFFKLEWPKLSGNFMEFPEIDRTQWFPINEAKKKIIKSLIPILEIFETWGV